VPRYGLQARLSRKSALGAVAENDLLNGVSFDWRGGAGAGGGSGGRCGVSVELEKIVRRGDQSPFGANRGSASASEAVDAAVELRVGKDRLDDRLALGVELAAALAGQDSAHERVKAAEGSLGNSKRIRVAPTRRAFCAHRPPRTTVMSRRGPSACCDSILVGGL
jgi:hypothetical protein